MKDINLTTNRLPTDKPAADHLAIDWARGEWADRPGKYSRQHLWVLAGAKLKASDSGALLPPAFRDEVAISPHNMFVATIASAHMLTWLSARRLPVLRVYKGVPHLRCGNAPRGIKCQD
jgi:hypothetical protein